MKNRKKETVDKLTVQAEERVMFLPGLLVLGD